MKSEKPHKNYLESKRDNAVWYIAAVAGTLALSVGAVNAVEGDADCIVTDEPTIPYPDFAACGENLFGADIDVINSEQAK